MRTMLLGACLLLGLVVAGCDHPGPKAGTPLPPSKELKTGKGRVVGDELPKP